MTSASSSDPPAMQSAIHGEATIDGQNTYAVIHDGVVTVYDRDSVVTIGASDVATIKWQQHIAVDRLTFAHDEGRKWNARVGGTSRDR